MTLLYSEKRPSLKGFYYLEHPGWVAHCPQKWKNKCERPQETVSNKRSLTVGGAMFKDHPYNTVHSAIEVLIQVHSSAIRPPEHKLFSHYICGFFAQGIHSLTANGFCKKVIYLFVCKQTGVREFKENLLIFLSRIRIKKAWENVRILPPLFQLLWNKLLHVSYLLNI